MQKICKRKNLKCTATRQLDILKYKSDVEAKISLKYFNNKDCRNVVKNCENRTCWDR